MQIITTQIYENGRAIIRTFEGSFFPDEYIFIYIIIIIIRSIRSFVLLLLILILILIRCGRRAGAGW